MFKRTVKFLGLRISLILLVVILVILAIVLGLMLVMGDLVVKIQQTSSNQVFGTTLSLN